MTERQENILRTAQQLFAEYGYANTSTKRIAQAADVSEGLIFKHFKSKEGLLDAIVDSGLKQGAQFFQKLLSEQDPRKIIELSLDIPLQIVQKHKEYWKLQISLKYQNPIVAEKYHNNEMLIHINEHITQAFQDLGYTNPKEEARLIQIVTSALFTKLIDEKDEDLEAFVSFMKAKYGL